jgi:hypothetical protein
MTSLAAWAISVISVIALAILLRLACCNRVKNVFRNLYCYFP